jgi:hypothetical protein
VERLTAMVGGEETSNRNVHQTHRQIQRRKADDDMKVAAFD